MGGGEHAEAGGIEEGDATQVDDDLGEIGVVEERLEDLAELRRRGRVDLARGDDAHRVSGTAHVENDEVVGRGVCEQSGHGAPLGA